MSSFVISLKIWFVSSFLRRETQSSIRVFRTSTRIGHVVTFTGSRQSERFANAISRFPNGWAEGFRWGRCVRLRCPRSLSNRKHKQNEIPNLIIDSFIYKMSIKINMINRWHLHTWMSLAWLDWLPVDRVDVVDKLRWLGVRPSEGFDDRGVCPSSSFSDLTPGSPSLASDESTRRIDFLFSPERIILKVIKLDTSGVSIIKSQLLIL